MEPKRIRIDTIIKKSISDVWNAWVNPDDITQWNHASDDWHCPKANSDLKVGGKFNYRMEAKDGSANFDFKGTFTKIEENQTIHFELADNRRVTVEFCQTQLGVRVVEEFEAENENPAELQRQGWQSILNNFKSHVESKA